MLGSYVMQEWLRKILNVGQTVERNGKTMVEMAGRYKELFTRAAIEEEPETRGK
jgi:hypothetical protein